MDGGGVSGSKLGVVEGTVVEVLVLGEVLVLLVRVPDLQVGRGGLWLKRELHEFMRVHEGLVPCMFWPPVDAAEGQRW